VRWVEAGEGVEGQGGWRRLGLSEQLIGAQREEGVRCARPKRPARTRIGGQHRQRLLPLPHRARLDQGGVVALHHAGQDLVCL